MLYYELVIVLDAALDDDSIKGMIEDLKRFVTERKGEILNIEEWGRRRLAYPIRKKENGYYVIVNFCLQDPEVLRPLETNLRLNEGVLRHLILKSRPPRKRPGEAEKREEETKVSEGVSAEKVSANASQDGIQPEKTELRPPPDSSSKVAPGEARAE